MRLLQINTAAKQSLVQSVLNLEKVTGTVWIGLTDILQEGRWRWNDGSLALYTNWGARNGNNYDYNVAYIVGYDQDDRYKWSPARGWIQLEFICETY